MRACALIVASLLAAVPAAAQEKVPFTIESMWAVQRVGAPVVSPDGSEVAFTVTSYDMDENRGNADIYVMPLAGGAPRRLTANAASDSGPAWSPDGTKIAFVSRRDADKASQVYVIAVSGGEAERLTSMPLGVGDLKWLPDGQRLVFVSHVIAGSESPEATAKALEAREKDKVKARVTENRTYRFWDRWLTDDEFPHFFVLDIATKKVTDLTPGSRRLFGLQTGSADYDISPDGSSIVFSALATPAPYARLNYDLFSVPVAGGEVRNLTPDSPGADTGPAFSPDGTRLAYGREVRGGGWPDYTRIAVRAMPAGTTTTLTEGWDYSPGDWQWTADGRTLVFTAEVRARVNLYAIDSTTGGTPREIHKGGTVVGPQVTGAGDVVFQRHAVDAPPELFTVKIDGTGYRKLTSTNDALMAKTAIGAMEEMTFKGAGGDDVQMFVVFPPNFERSKKYPLVQLVHGGPIGTFGDGFSFRWHPHAFAAPGYVVAMVNFHGSSSFGQKWIESILGAHADKPFTDVMAATDVLIGKGYIDETRMAAAGGSYGGYLVNWIAGHTNRFKALVSHAGVYSLTGQFASDGTEGREHSYGGYPFTNLANIEKWSPNRYATGFQTPMLVIHGERDFRVPVTQGLELYGVLSAKGIPARLVYYPDENHWILKPQNSRHWYGEVLGWLKKYLS
jgi:dipeptidyl aminopeptidase/acylaminoacyl peptidase